MKNIIFFLFLICSSGCDGDKPQKPKEAFKIPAIPYIEDNTAQDEFDKFEEIEALILESLIDNDYGPV